MQPCVDSVAVNLARAARMARGMPPSYRSHGDGFPLATWGGKHVGVVLPGVGVYVDADLKDLGITRPIPNVVERSRAGRAIDALLDRRGSITTFDGIVAAIAAGGDQRAVGSKNSFTTVAAQWSTLFRAGGMPTAGTYTNIPTGAVLTNASAGSLTQMLGTLGGGNKKYLLTFGLAPAQQINMTMLVDQLVGAGNINANTTSANTITSAALTRFTSGVGVLMTFEVTTALGSTTSNITVSYTNSAGTAAQSTGAVVVTTSAIVQRILPIATGPFIGLAAGDVGVQAVASATFSAAMGASSAMALILYKPVALMPASAAGLYQEMNSTNDLSSFVELVQDGSNVIGCYNMFVLTNTTSTGIVNYSIKSIDG